MSFHRSPSGPRISSILGVALAAALVGSPMLAAAPLYTPLDGGWSVERILSRVGQLLRLDGFGSGETIATTKDGGSTTGGTEECPDDDTGTGGTGGTTSSSGTTTSGCEDDATGGTTGSTAGSDPNGG